MTDEETQKLAWRIFEKLQAIGCVIGNASVPHIERELEGFASVARAAALEEAAQRAELIAGRDTNPHSRETSRQIATAIRALLLGS